MKNFQSLLVANRGEIAVRIMRTASALGLRTIGVYSEADASSPHVGVADDAVLIGPAPASESYLHIDRIIQAAAESGAQAIHPGYGFLSENAAFAIAVREAGLVFVGPDPLAIELMGDKAAAKRRMIEAGVPCVPGYQGDDQNDAHLATEASRIGYPVMVKATAGGGGRGMRLVEQERGLADALSVARSEAMNTFGSERLIIEKAIVNARHVEIQIFADHHGNVIHLGERDCSVQRRHQKVVEEAPCPVMTDTLRAAMGGAAVEAARSIGYQGAGTVEFLLDETGAFYFLEMNTRLQVEHPVTEMFAGLDLVQMQLQVADGDALDISQSDVEWQGHAMEARLYAEDAAAGFLPSTGVIERWQPFEDDDVRVDSGIDAGQVVSPFYDPMLAKFIAWGNTRDQARLNLIHALKETELFGVTTNRGFLIDILENRRFADGLATTSFITEEFSDHDLAPPAIDNPTLAIAATLMFANARSVALQNSLAVPAALLNWSSGDPIWSVFKFDCAQQNHVVKIRPATAHSYLIVINNAGDDEALDVSDVQLDPGVARMTVNGRRHSVSFAHLSGGRLQLCEAGRVVELILSQDGLSTAEDAADSGRVIAPMHGIVVDVLVQPGDIVSQGDKLAVMEAMKMQHDLRAGADGAVTAVHLAQGQQVGEGDLLIEIQTQSFQTTTQE